ncbi:MAG: hypothetical protein AB7O26_18695, partial [Planctomycetaceae bacterium]
MKRSTIIRWGIVVCLFSCGGCGTTRGTMFGSFWNKADSVAEKTDDREQEKVASINPFKRGEKKKKADAEKPAETETASKENNPAETPAAKPTDAKPADAKQKSEPATRLATHDAETLKLIDEELKDATPEERERLYNEWKPLDGPMLKQVIGIRRMVRQMGQGTPKQQMAAVSPETNGGTAPLASKVDQLAAQIPNAGHASGQHTAGRTAPSPLGASPWSQPGVGGQQSLALNSAYGSPGAESGFNVAPANRSMNDPRIVPAAATQQSADGASPGAQLATYSTTSPGNPYGNGFAPATAPASTGGLTISPGPRSSGLAQEASTAQPAFAGSVSTNGGPQVAAGAGGLSPY